VQWESWTGFVTLAVCFEICMRCICSIADWCKWVVVVVVVVCAHARVCVCVCVCVYFDGSCDGVCGFI